MKSYLDFREGEPSKSGLTKMWGVYPTTAQDQLYTASLGRISWYAAWRRYVFFPSYNTLFDVQCLRAIADFIETQMEIRK